ncbi:acyl-CoA thioesterase [Streptomyces fuscichromogenes]|uniref:acyl-CoA thioesterase n=1 Tax=Streptomyces fuscichromogenes TaxID=1324013 RepID=UPI00382A4F05
MPADTSPIVPDISQGRLIPVTVHFDELDALGMLHNARYPLLVERAWLSLWQQEGFGFAGDWQAAGDASNVVKELRITYELPVHDAGPHYALHVWLERLGSTSLTHGFRFCAADGGVTHAVGTRTLIRVDPDTGRPMPWSERLREVGRTLMRPSS